MTFYGVLNFINIILHKKSVHLLPMGRPVIFSVQCGS